MQRRWLAIDYILSYVDPAAIMATTKHPLHWIYQLAIVLVSIVSGYSRVTTTALAFNSRLFIKQAQIENDDTLFVNLH